MVIEKSETPGYYVASQKIGDRKYIAVGDSHQDAINRLLAKLKWLELIK